MNIMKFVVSCVLLACTNSLIAVPVVTDVKASHGPRAGGNNVKVIGSGFMGTTSVDFGTHPATFFMVMSDNQILATVPPGSPGTVDVEVTVGMMTSAHSPDDFYTYTEAGWQGIVSVINNDSVMLFNTDTNTFDAIIPLPNDGIASTISPDGKIIYSADDNPPNVKIIDAATNTIVGNIPLSGGPGTFDIIINPDGTRLYISNINTGRISVVDTATNTEIDTILVAPQLGPLSIKPDGTTLYVVSFGFGSVFTIDTATNTVGVSIPTGLLSGKISITPDGSTAYVANAGTFTGDDNVAIVDLSTNLITSRIPFPGFSGPYGSILPPNTQKLFVASINSSEISVIDLNTNTIVDVQSAMIGSHPFWMVTTPDSKTVYVIYVSVPFVTPIDVATNTFGANFGSVDGDEQDIVMSPDQAPVSSFVVTAMPAGVPSLFNAKSSVSPVGTIVQYEWDFGDGNTLTTNNPKVQHTYATTAVFNVTLTVTNSAGTSTTKVFTSTSMLNNGSDIATSSQLVRIPPHSPTDPSGFQRSCRFPTQSDIINVISWNPPAGGVPAVAYEIYRDAALTDLIAVIPASGPLTYEDHNRRPNIAYTYYIVAVDSMGGRSMPAVVTVQPN